MCSETLPPAKMRPRGEAQSAIFTLQFSIFNPPAARLDLNDNSGLTVAHLHEFQHPAPAALSEHPVRKSPDQSIIKSDPLPSFLCLNRRPGRKGEGLIQAPKLL